MGFVSCSRCGQEWDNTYIEKEMSESDRLKFRKGSGCPHCWKRDSSKERETSFACDSIQEILTEISDRFIALTLKFARGVGKRGEIVPGGEAYMILEEFFISCQKAEERIKDASKKGFLTKKQVHHLNERIGGEVTTVLRISKYTPSISDLIRELAETKPAIMEILQSFTTPRSYEDFQFLIRRREPSDHVSLYRSTWEKGV